MLKLAYFFTSAFLLVSSVHCYAEEVPDPTMINTLKCEAGRVGVRMAKAGLARDKKVIVSWTHTRTISRGAGIGLTFPWLSLGGSGDLSREELNELKSEGQAFNLNAGNASVCWKIHNEIIKNGIGLYDCLVNKKFLTLRNSIEQKTGTASCRTKVTLSKQLKGNLRLQVWGVDIGPNASWGDLEVYEIAIAAPKQKKGD